MTNIASIKNLVSDLRNKLAEGDKLFTGQLATRLIKAADKHPEDVPVRMMASFLSDRARKGGYLISRAELRDVYNKMYSPNSVCGEYLARELNRTTQEKPERKPLNPEPMQNVHNNHSDHVLVSALESAFDKNVAYKPYAPEVAKVAKDNCQRVLPGNPTVKVVGGNEDAILCEAIYETPKGRSHVLIPVEISVNKAFLPSVFVTQAGFVNLTEERLADYVVKTAGQKLRVDVQQVFKAIELAKHGAPEPVSEVERIVAMAHLRCGTPASHDPNAILSQVEPEDAPGCEIKTASSPETQSFAKALNSPAGTAEFIFGRTTAEAGRILISQALHGFGYSTFQVKVSSVDDNHIIYAVAVKDGSGFKVPVKIEKSLPKYPSVIIANGSPAEFSKAGIDQASADNTARATALGFDLGQPQKLIEVVAKACESKNFLAAGEALRALAESKDQTAYRCAFNMYHNALASDGKAPAPKLKTIKLADGNEVCAQTFLPPHKVYVDANGVAHAKHRQHEDKVESAGGFMNAKVLLGL